MTDEQINPQYHESDKTAYREQQSLLLHNDPYNSFDYIIQTLVEECKHDTTQAEQCAILTHHKGKCEIMKGDLFELQKIKNILHKRGLTVTIVEP